MAGVPPATGTTGILPVAEAIFALDLAFVFSRAERVERVDHAAALRYYAAERVYAAAELWGLALIVFAISKSRLCAGLEQRLVFKTATGAGDESRLVRLRRLRGKRRARAELLPQFLPKRIVAP